MNPLGDEGGGRASPTPILWICQWLSLWAFCEVLVCVDESDPSGEVLCVSWSMELFFDGGKHDSLQGNSTNKTTLTDERMDAQTSVCVLASCDFSCGDKRERRKRTGQERQPCPPSTSAVLGAPRFGLCWRCLPLPLWHLLYSTTVACV